MPFGNTCHESRSCTWICSSAPGNYFTCLVFFTFSSWLTSLNHPMNVRIEKAPSFRRNFICWGRESKSHYEREGGNYPWNKTALISLIFDLGRPINQRDPFTININPPFPVPASGVSPIVCLKGVGWIWRDSSPVDSLRFSRPRRHNHGGRRRLLELEGFHSLPFLYWFLVEKRESGEE